MTARLITLTGCHETTTFVAGNLSSGDDALLDRLAALSRDTSTCECEPYLTVQAVGDEVRQ